MKLSNIFSGGYYLLRTYINQTRQQVSYKNSDENSMALLFKWLLDSLLFLIYHDSEYTIMTIAHL